MQYNSPLRMNRVFERILRFSVDLSCEIIGNVVTDIILGPNTIHRNFQSWYNSIHQDREVIYTNN